jgi:hypothetical protein
MSNPVLVKIVMFVKIVMSELRPPKIKENQGFLDGNRLLIEPFDLNHSSKRSGMQNGKNF